MTRLSVRALSFSAAAAVLMLSAPALAATCQQGTFDTFLSAFGKEAAAKGVSARGLAALKGLTVDEKVLAADKRQHVFKQSFEEFSGRMISQSRLTKAAKLMQQHGATLKKVEQQFGVPGAMVVAIWGLETDYGVNQGKMSVVRSTATLAFDCRRTDKFQGELLEALRIIDKGDMSVEHMKGDWAGEIGQTQFLPSSYNKYAVDFDGDGRRDLVSSVPDVLASTANYLKGHGWQRGQGYGPNDPNFAAIKEWNKAEVYAKTIAAFAQRIDAQAKGGSAGSDKRVENTPPAGKTVKR